MNNKNSLLVRKLIRQLDSGTSCHVSRHPSTYAYDNRELVARLTWERYKSAKEYLANKDHEFYRHLRKFEDTSAAATYSPHRPLKDKPYFVETETLEDLNILHPYPDGAIKETHVVHVGPKGSGKTTVQNHWLYTNHDDLEDENVFYVRCDAPKIFDFWLKNVRMSLEQEVWPVDYLPTIEEYLDFQTLYIIAKYSHVGLPKVIFYRLQAEQIKFKFKEARAADAPERSTQLVSWFIEEHIKKVIDNYECGDQNRSYIVDCLFTDKPTRRREFIRWKECADAVKSWMRGAGFITIRILDGVDNLHLNTSEGKKIYNAFIPEVAKFILRAAPLKEIRYAVMRNRTWMDVQRTDPVTLGSGTIINPWIINHIPPEFDELSQKRILWLEKCSDANECTKVLAASVSVMPSSEVLHKNMRTLIVGASSLASQVRFRFHQLSGKIDIKRQASIQIKRNLFLNGRFYLSTEKDFATMNREKGLPYLNPFWFPAENLIQHEGRDPLFLRIRMLEFLNTGPLVDTTLISYLVDGFSYSKDHVISAIDDARAFGWIASKSMSGKASHVTYELHEAGRYLLIDLLRDVDVLYMLALDTRLPKKFFSAGLIQVHTNHMYQRTGYIGAAAVTVFTFISWLTQVLRKELNEVNTNMFNGDYTQEFMSRNARKKIISNFIRMLRNAEEEDWLIMEPKFKLLSELTL